MNKLAALTVLAPVAAFSLLTLSVHADSLADTRAVAVATSNHAAGAPAGIAEGMMVYSANGQSLVPVYRVNGDSTVQLIVGRRLLTIPAAMLSEVDGKLTSSVTRRELLR